MQTFQISFKYEQKWLVVCIDWWMLTWEIEDVVFVSRSISDEDFYQPLQLSISDIAARLLPMLLTQSSQLGVWLIHWGYFIIHCLIADDKTNLNNKKYICGISCLTKQYLFLDQKPWNLTCYWWTDSQKLYDSNNLQTYLIHFHFPSSGYSWLSVGCNGSWITPISR